MSATAGAGPAKVKNLEVHQDLPVNDKDPNHLLPLRGTQQEAGAEAESGLEPRGLSIGSRSPKQWLKA